MLVSSVGAEVGAEVAGEPDVGVVVAAGLLQAAAKSAVRARPTSGRL
jgi:hypothetical protein